MSLPDLEGPLALLEQKDVDTAVDVLEQKVDTMPAHLGAHVLLAYAYEAQRRWDRALEAWANAHFLMPNAPLATAGKRRVLRRMDGIEDDGPTPLADALPLDLSPGPAETTDTAPPEASDETPESPEAEDFGLAQLRRQAEREARQGGARPGLSDAAPSPDAPPSGEDPSPSADESPTPEEQVERLEDEDDPDDLDHLIDKLQSAQVTPSPGIAADAPTAADAPDEDPADDIVSETLAQIHAGQDDYQKAARIYTQLAEQEPARADEFRKKAARMREKAEGTGDDASGDDA